MIPDGVETADLKPAKLTPTSCMYSLYDLSRPEPKLIQRTQLKKTILGILNPYLRESF